MKKLILVCFGMIMYAATFAQTGSSPKQSALGGGFFFNDFITPAEIKKNGLGNVIKDKNLFRSNRMDIGVALNYYKGLTNHVDFVGGLEACLKDGPSNIFLAAIAGVDLKLLSDKYWFVPFATVGVGGAKLHSAYSAILPVGAGLRINIGKEAFLRLSTQYRFPVTDNIKGYLQHSLGIGVKIAVKEAPPKEVIVPVVEAPKDRDGDGIIDAEDECPDQAGPASLKGCPDRDGDNIADKNDNCPDVPGLAKYKGCPIPDTDHDGINDEEDKCPTVAGVARYQGCPVPDTDQDGVNDEEDKCPNQAGPASNFGCPVIAPEVIEKVNMAARNVFFATGSAKLLAKSYPSLNNVVKILQDNPTYMVDVEGHTDTTGTHEKNMVLSNDRAASVKAYLVSKGIEEGRIKSEGFGPDRPIATNKTAAGKAKNRRVEMKLRNY